MVRSKRKKAVKRNDMTSDDSFRTLRARRSSMRVNLSYVSNLSDSGVSRKISEESCETSVEEPFVRNDGAASTVKKCRTKKFVNNESPSSANETIVTIVNRNSDSSSSRTVTEETESTLLNVITEKEQQLNKSCMQLKDVIMRKTQAFFDRENELAIKTSEVLASGYMSPVHNIGELDNDVDKRSPSVRVNISKNEQVVMSGDGKEKNPVQVSSMLLQNSPVREHNASSDKSDDDQSIVSTPKKTRIDSSSEEDNPSNKNSGTMLRMPVTRLFTDDDPNNSMSRMDSIDKVQENNPMETESNNSQENASIASNTSRISNELNYSTSPILSQGTRRSRACLSLKKKCSNNITQISSRLSTTTVNESFINKVPLTCSSFIEKPDDFNKRNGLTEQNKTVILEDKSNSVNNCKTIDLGDNSKTIEIDNSINSSSCMEMTTISAKMPIIRRSIQQTVHKSQTTNAHDNTKTPLTSQKQKSPISTQTKDSNKEVNVLEPVERTNSNNVRQENCTSSTERTSLNVNTSLDQINSDHIVQKENKTPNNLQGNVRIHEDHTDKESDTAAIQCPNTYSSRSSIQVNGSSDSVKKSSNTVSKSLDVSNKLSSRQSTSSIATTVRTSMHVNTSLDSVKKSPKKKNLDFHKMLSMVQETSTNQSLESSYSSKEQSLSSDNDLENMSLMERIRNISATKKLRNSKVLSDNANANKKSLEGRGKKCSDKGKSIETPNKSIKTTRKSGENKQVISKVSNEPECINSKITRKSNILEHNNSKRKSVEEQNVSTNSNESSIVEATPYPISRSVLMKTMIKNNIAMNSIDPRKIVNYSGDEDSNTELETIIKNKRNLSPKQCTSVRKEPSTPDSMDTVVADSSDESANECDKRGGKIVIEESLNETKGNNRSMNNSKMKNVSVDEENNSKKEAVKRKLYLVRDNSQLVSFSPAEDTQDSHTESESKEVKTKKKRKMTHKKKQEKKCIEKSPEPANIEETQENEILPEKVTKVKKKPRKIKRKKIVIKKVRNMSLINNILNNAEEVPSRLSNRSSLGEFDLKNSRSCRKENSRKGSKIIIVVTGLSKEDKDLVKSVIKTLGSAVLETNVTPRTTHVISTGVRTINLLKGIIRGCWLVNLEWALKSLESEKWLEPNTFEMTHFAKAVQENRRDRQLFGKGYVPELFVTSGFIYVENGTSPPTATLKELIKIAGGKITDDPGRAEIIIGSDGLKEIWVLDSITTGEVQPIDQYKRN